MVGGLSNKLLHRFYIALGIVSALKQSQAMPEIAKHNRLSFPKLALTSVGVGVVSAGMFPLYGVWDLANIVMIYMLLVLVVAIKLGRSAGFFASIACVLLLDFLFTAPRFSLRVDNAHHVVTFMVMLAVSYMTAEMASRLKQSAVDAQEREQRTHALYRVARDLSGVNDVGEATQITKDFIATQIKIDAHVMALQTHVVTDAHVLNAAFHVETHIATMALIEGRTVSSSSASASGWGSVYIPLMSGKDIHGMLILAKSASHDHHIATSDISFAEAFGSLLAITLERLHYVDVAQQTQISSATERMRASILSALSHDLRTPLTVLVGLADSLLLAKNSLSSEAENTLRTIQNQARRLSNLGTNLLEMARLSSGAVQLKREWHLMEDVVCASVEHFTASHHAGRLKLAIQPDLPLIEIDPVLIETVLNNLIENAFKYSPSETPVTLAIHTKDACLTIEVSDEGKGFDETMLTSAFDLFERGHKESSIPGFGIGLSICKIIVEAHGGKIQARNNTPVGAVVEVCLPLGTPPAVWVDEV